jgi:predicted transcriptional regulator
MSSSTSVKLDPTRKAKIAALAKKRGVTPHALMVQAIEEYVEREERRLRLQNEVIAQWKESQLTGEPMPREKLDEWLSILAARKAPLQA